MALNERQTKFAENYAKHGNATKAYAEAGYESKSIKSDEANAARLIRNDKVASYIKELTDKIRSQSIADLVEIKEFWTKVIRSDEEETPHRLKAAELIAKTQGAFIDKIEHSGKIDVNDISSRLMGKK